MGAGGVGCGCGSRGLLVEGAIDDALSVPCAAYPPCPPRPPSPARCSACARRAIVSSLVRAGRSSE